MSISDQEAPVAAHVPARRRRHAGAAAARLDDSGRRRRSADRRRAGRRASARSTSRTAPSCRSGRRPTEGAGFELSRDPAAAQAVPRASINVISDLECALAYGSGATANHNRSAAAFLSGAFAKTGAQAGAGHHDRPGRRAEDRPGHAAAVARADDRGGEPQLRRRPELRLPRHDLVAGPELAAADGEQPAGRLRAAVRRRQHGRGARGAPRSSRSACSIRCSARRRRCSARCRPSDRTRLDQYLTDVREIERRIQKAGAAAVRRPAGAGGADRASRTTSKSTSS